MKRYRRPLIGCYHIIADRRQVLLVNQGRGWSLPGGKPEIGESLAAAVVRETREEAGIQLHPSAIVGFYQVADLLGTNVLNIAFCSDRPAAVDSRGGSVRFFSRDEIAMMMQDQRLRDNLMIPMLNDYWRGVRLPLEIVTNVLWTPSTPQSRLAM